MRIVHVPAKGAHTPSLTLALQKKLLRSSSWSFCNRFSSGVNR